MASDRRESLFRRAIRAMADWFEMYGNIFLPGYGYEVYRKPKEGEIAENLSPKTRDNGEVDT